jgi:hypothetical protein
MNQAFLIQYLSFYWLGKVIVEKSKRFFCFRRCSINRQGTAGAGGEITSPTAKQINAG